MTPSTSAPNLDVIVYEFRTDVADIPVFTRTMVQFLTPIERLNFDQPPRWMRMSDSPPSPTINPQQP